MKKLDQEQKEKQLDFLAGVFTGAIIMLGVWILVEVLF